MIDFVLLSHGTTCARTGKTNASCQFLIPSSGEFEAFDVNLGRDVVLDVVPVRADLCPKLDWTIKWSSKSSFIRRLAVWQFVLHVPQKATKAFNASPDHFSERHE